VTVGSAFVHVLIWLLAPEKRDYYATMKMVAYSSPWGCSVGYR
jgi:S-ribosylhomocysteine lyase LuxS involved in autoinducer biosynthesis